MGKENGAIKSSADHTVPTSYLDSMLSYSGSIQKRRKNVMSPIRNFIPGLLAKSIPERPFGDFIVRLFFNDLLR
jgi:hypothetical protein